MNGVALVTLLRKELRRFGKVWLQTVLGPLVTTSLYFLVFGVALGSRLREVDGVPYVAFVVPGLMMLAMINNAFLNSSSSLFQSKVNGTIVDLLVAPIGAGEMLAAYVAAAMARALLVGALVFAVASAFLGVRVAHPGWALYFALMVTSSFGLFGLAVAVLAEKFDHLAIFPNLILTPLVFLGGVFYSVDMLPEPWRSVSLANPILYMVNGLRYGLLGTSDVPVAASAGAVAAFFAVGLAAAWGLLGSGYKLRA